MNEGCHRFQREIGWQGGYLTHTVNWNPREKIWSVFDPEAAQGRYWCAFGTQDPREHQMLDIVMECNSPLKGVNRRCAGAFLKAGQQVFVAHSGKIGGGRKGIGKSSFVESYPHGNWQIVEWPDEVLTEMVIIGRINSKRLPKQLAHIVREVEKFKSSVTSGGKRSNQTIPRSTFSPEFAGQRRSYRVARDIESSCDHGLVVNLLKRCLKRRGIKMLANDRARDLYILSKGQRIRILFEVKTDLSTSSIYQGIGQLIYHGASAEKSPHRILVLPGEPTAETQKVLAQIGIEVLRYKWEDGNAVFQNLENIRV